LNHDFEPNLKAENDSLRKLVIELEKKLSHPSESYRNLLNEKEQTDNLNK